LAPQTCDVDAVVAILVHGIKDRRQLVEVEHVAQQRRQLQANNNHSLSARQRTVSAPPPTCSCLWTLNPFVAVPVQQRGGLERPAEGGKSANNALRALCPPQSIE
jgi:hypothetical protein